MANDRILTMRRRDRTYRLVGAMLTLLCCLVGFSADAMKPIGVALKTREVSDKVTLTELRWNGEGKIKTLRLLHDGFLIDTGKNVLKIDRKGVLRGTFTKETVRLMQIVTPTSKIAARGEDGWNLKDFGLTTRDYPETPVPSKKDDSVPILYPAKRGLKSPDGSRIFVLSGRSTSPDSYRLWGPAIYNRKSGKLLASHQFGFTSTFEDDPRWCQTTGDGGFIITNGSETVRLNNDGKVLWKREVQPASVELNDPWRPHLEAGGYVYCSGLQGNATMILGPAGKEVVKFPKGRRGVRILGNRYLLSEQEWRKTTINEGGKERVLEERPHLWELHDLKKKGKRLWSIKAPANFVDQRFQAALTDDQTSIVTVFIWHKASHGRAVNDPEGYTIETTVTPIHGNSAGKASYKKLDACLHRKGKQQVRDLRSRDGKSLEFLIQHSLVRIEL